MEYKIIVAEGKVERTPSGEQDVVEGWDSKIARFEKQINEMIKEGWKPLGGCQSNMAHYFDFACMQTMIKE